MVFRRPSRRGTGAWKPVRPALEAMVGERDERQPVGEPRERVGELAELDRGLVGCGQSIGDLGRLRGRVAQEVEVEPLAVEQMLDVDQRRRSEEALRQLSLQNAYLQEEIKATHNVDEVVAKQPSLQGERIRVQGNVVDGTVHKTAEGAASASAVRVACASSTSPRALT